MNYRPSETFYTSQGLPDSTEVELTDETSFMYEVISLFVGDPLDAWKANISAPSRRFNGKVFIRDNEYDDEFIEEITIDETVNPDETFALGSVASSKLELTVLNITNENFENAVIRPHVGLDVNGVIEYVPLGVFTVDEVDINKGRANLVGFDNMIKLEKPYFSDLTYPASLRAVTEEICAKAGVSLATIIPTTSVQEISGYTLREAIGFVASFLGGFARFNRIGELEVIQYQSTDEEITTDNYIDLQTSERTFSIGKLTCKIADEEDGETTISTGSGSIEIYFENPIMTQSQLNTIFNELSTLNYMPYTMNWQGNPSIQAGDKVRITDVNGQTYSTLLMDQQIKYNGGLSATASAKGKTESAQEFSSSGTLTQKMERYTIEQALIKEALIDKATIGDLTAVNARIENLSAEYATIENLDATNARINNLTVDFATIEDLDAVNARITNLQVDSAMIEDLAVTTAKIEDASITSAKIMDAAINSAKIEDAAITSAKIGDAQITTAKIEVGAITTALIEVGAIESAQIADASITDAHIVNLTANKIVAGTIDTGQVTLSGPGGMLQIKNNRLQVFDSQPTPVERVSLGDVNDDGSIYGFRVRGADGTTVLYDENGVYNEGITDGAITNPKIGDGAVENRHIIADTITGNKLVVDSITGREIKAQEITANHMTANSITAANGAIANLAVTTAKIADAAITNVKIANATITSAKIESLDAGKIKTGTLTAIDITGVNIRGSNISGGTIRSENTDSTSSIELYRERFTSEYLNSYGGVTERNRVYMERGQIWLTDESGLSGLDLTTNYSSYIGASHMSVARGSNTSVMRAEFVSSPEVRTAHVTTKSIGMIGDSQPTPFRIYTNGNYTFDIDGTGSSNVDTIIDTNKSGFRFNKKVEVRGLLNVMGAVSASSEILIGSTGRLADSGGMTYVQSNISVRATKFKSTTLVPMHASAFNTTSLAKLKQDIVKWEDSALEKINATTLWEYRLKSEVEDGFNRVRQGLVIGKGYNTPYGVVDNDSVEMYLMNTWSWKAIQELSTIQNNHADEINWLKMENQLLRGRIQKLEGAA